MHLREDYLSKMGNPYLQGSDIIIVSSEDCTGRKLSKQRSNVFDEEAVGKMFQSIIDKYRLGLKVVKAEPRDKLKFLKEDEEFKW